MLENTGYRKGGLGLKAYYKEKEINNPFLKISVVFFVLIAGVIDVLIFVLSSPLWMPLDLVLKRLGREGFIKDSYETLTVHFKGGFQRRQ